METSTFLPFASRQAYAARKPCGRSLGLEGRSVNSEGREPLETSPPETPPKPAAFNPDNTQTFRAKMPSAPGWFSAMLAGNNREKIRLRLEMEQIKGAVPLLMYQRNGDKWTPQDTDELKKILRSVSSVSPYLLIWVLPGSILILPFLAWHLDTRRKRRLRAD